MGASAPQGRMQAKRQGAPAGGGATLLRANEDPKLRFRGDRRLQGRSAATTLRVRLRSATGLSPMNASMPPCSAARRQGEAVVAQLALEDGDGRDGYPLAALCGGDLGVEAAAALVVI